jgi:hypothetical protein
MKIFEVICLILHLVCLIYIANSDLDSKYILLVSNGILFAFNLNNFIKKMKKHD